jgi:hypothetical protein
MTDFVHRIQKHLLFSELDSRIEALPVRIIIAFVRASAHTQVKDGVHKCASHVAVFVG